MRDLPGAIAPLGTAVVGSVLDAHGMAQSQPLACGGGHSAMLSKEGVLYTWGSNDHGQCGREGSRQTLPGPVHTLTARKLIGVACGGGHTLALTDQGRLYSFGLNGTGQLGNGSNNMESNPTPGLVRITGGIVISSFACGEEFSAAITSDGRLLTWGFGGCGQLGHGTVISLRLPRQVPCEPVAQVACGMGHTSVRTSRGGILRFGHTGNWNSLAQMDDETRRSHCTCLPKVRHIAPRHLTSLAILL